MEQANSLIEMALRKQEHTSTMGSGLPPFVLEISRRAEQLLAEWNAPLTIRLAALLSPLVKYQPAMSRALIETFGSEPIRLAEQAVAPCLQSELVQAGEDSAWSAQFSLKLRRLFRLAYLEPDLVILLLAQQDACLEHLDALPVPARRRVAAETEAVFVPLAEMCGIWRLRRKWLDLSAWVLAPKECMQIADALADTESERAIAFHSLKEKLRAKSAEEGVQCEIELVEPHVGTIRHRCREGESRDELVGRLAVKILCGSSSDCYRMLGLAHSLGDRVAARFSKRMEDYIAAPQPNGYRALHTAILYKGYKESGGEILVEFRILTREMYQLNELGLVQDRYIQPIAHDIPAWWTRLKALSDVLHRRWEYAEDIRNFVNAFDLGTRSNPLYVFTPRGEILLLHDGSTPLDFAYHIHTELGNHAARVWVNDQVTPYHLPLHNGDIVRVDYDPRFVGPELPWLDFVVTSSARAKIRRGLTARAKSIHEGRARIEDLLLKMLRYYERHKGYKLQVGTNQLDAFLYRMAKVRGLRTLNELYDQVTTDRLPPDKLVRRFITEELIGAIVNAEGYALDYPLHHISLCDICRPVPGESLVAFERRVGTSTKGLMIHRRGNDSCPGIRAGGQPVDLRWLEASSSGKSFAELQVTARDRYRLLGDILDAVYEEPGVYVHKANAQAHGDGGAEILLTIEYDMGERLAHIQRHISAVRNVNQVRWLPLSPARRLTLATPSVQRLSNPYTEQEVYDRQGFYDREEPIQILLDWLQTPPPTRWLVLHGQRRVGKTSLAKYLIHEVLPARPFLPVFVDLQALSQFTPDRVINHIASQTQKAFQQARKKPLESPVAATERGTVVALSGLFDRAMQELKGHRLLLILDEFDVLLDKAQVGELDPLVFANLRALMSEWREVNFLLIVQDAYFHEPDTWGGAGTLFQKGTDLALLPLEHFWARKLILEPASRLGIRYEREGEQDTVVNLIQSLTGGHPYFIHVLCWRLVERVRSQNRNMITRADVEWVTNAVLSDGERYFHHFLPISAMKGIGRIVLSYIAAQSSENTWRELRPIISNLNRLTGHRIDSKSLKNAVHGLVRGGVLEIQGEQKSQQTRIPVGLFHRWVRSNLDVDIAIKEWQAIRRKQR